MICLLLIMTMIFINGTESAEQKIRHSDTLLKEEEANAKTKAWLLMVESGKVDQEELRRITPKSIFIAPLLSGRSGKCKEGFRHDHLGQCVKVIKIDPQAQLELLLQKLNKLYGDKKEEKEEEKEELFEVSSGPLHFSLPISNGDEKAGQTTSEAKPEAQQVSSTTAAAAAANATAFEEQNATEFIPIPVLHQNQTNQTKEIESSEAEPFNETDTQETSRFEGSGDDRSASGDGFPEEEKESTTPSRVGLIPEESDYFDATEPEWTTFAETQSATEPPEEAFAATKATLQQPLPKGSYQNITDASSVYKANDGSAVSPKENAREESKITFKNDSDSERIHFPSDEDDVGVGGGGGSRTPPKPPAYGSRIRFPDEPPPERRPPSSVSLPDSARYQMHPSAISREQFWWLPKNWQIDENQHKSALVKVWSRLPLIHDVAYSRDTADDFKKPLSPDEPPPGRGDEAPPPRPVQQQQTSRIVKPFKSSRFQDILITPRQNFRFQR